MALLYHDYSIFTTAIYSIVFLFASVIEQAPPKIWATLIIKLCY